MTQSNIATETVTVNTPVNNVSEVKKASFWISQCFIIVATVLGVYLAATQGFKQAVQFENIVSQKNAYYLQKSLKNEMTNNVAEIESFLKKAKESNDPWAVYPLNYSLFIWNNMLASPTSLQLSPEVLFTSEKFVSSLQKNYEKATTGAQEQRKAGIKALEELVELANTKIIPELNKNIGKIDNELKRLNIEL